MGGAAFVMLSPEELEQIIERAVRRTLELRPPASPDDYLTADEAAGIAKVDASTIREWIRDGKLAARHAGSRVRLRRADLDAYLARPPEAPAESMEAAVARLLR
jgi:excisionase family DNA binding protein